MKKYIVILFALITVLGISAQEKSQPIFYVGPYADLNYNYHFTNFGNLPPFPNCCPVFRSGKGIGFSIGGLIEREILPDIVLGLRLGISDISAKLKTTEYIGGTYIKLNRILIDLIDTTAIVDYTIKSKLLLIDAEPYIGMRVFEKLSLNLGFKFGYLITSKFDQSETLLKPDNVTYMDGSRRRNYFTNEQIPNINAFQIFTTISVFYELPLGNDIKLNPELRFSVPFLDISKSVSGQSDYWKASTFQLGASLRFPIYPPPPPVHIDTIYKQEIFRDTTLIALKNAEERIELAGSKSTNNSYKAADILFVDSTTIYEHYNHYIRKIIGLDVKVTAWGWDSAGKKTYNPVITIEETEEVEGFPLLTQVFFNDGSSELSNSNLNLIKSNQIDSFNENNLKNNTLSIYSDLLNIIGSRLKKNPQASVIISGCNNNQSPREINNLKLSIDRANVIKDYLISTWGIETNRIKIKRQNLPSNPGNITVNDGIVENQRAEITSDIYEIIKPVFLSKITRSANPPEITIKPEVKSDAGLKNWDVQVSQLNHNLRNYAGIDMPDSLIWKVETEPMPSTEDSVNVQFSAIDNEIQKNTAISKFKINQNTIRKKRYELKDDKKIQKYSLILFDYDKSELTPAHLRILEMIKKEIIPGSKVEITGYADRTGLPDYNRELAKRRAEETKKQLFVDGVDYKIIPVGSDELIYDNDTPQGRSYCRTVKIRIESPIK